MYTQRERYIDTTIERGREGESDQQSAVSLVVVVRTEVVTMEVVTRTSVALLVHSGGCLLLTMIFVTAWFVTRSS